MRITKIYFPLVTVVKMEGEGLDPAYWTTTEGHVRESFYPVGEDLLVTEEDWRRALQEAKTKGARIELFEV